jgi:uncharacterized OB-fold protein
VYRRCHYQQERDVSDPRQTPPAARTDTGRRLAESADSGQLLLPRCRNCSTVQYPPREICRSCLGADLEWAEIPGDGAVLSWTRLQASVEPFFQSRLPWLIVLVKLDCGPILFAHLAGAAAATGMRVIVHNRRDVHGNGILIAAPAGADPDWSRLQPLLG